MARISKALEIELPKAKDYISLNGDPGHITKWKRTRTWLPRKCFVTDERIPPFSMCWMRKTDALIGHDITTFYGWASDKGYEYLLLRGKV